MWLQAAGPFDCASQADLPGPARDYVTLQKTAERVAQALAGSGLEKIPGHTLHTFGSPPEGVYGLADESLWVPFMQEGALRLKEAGKAIREKSRPYDGVGRYEADMFLIALPGVIGQDAEKIAERILKDILSTNISLLDGREITQPGSALTAITLGFSVLPAALTLLSLWWLVRYSLEADQVEAHAVQHVGAAA